jgi:hypothetical protein
MGFSLNPHSFLDPETDPQTISSPSLFLLFEDESSSERQPNNGTFSLRVRLETPLATLIVNTFFP